MKKNINSVDSTNNLTSLLQVATPILMATAQNQQQIPETSNWAPVRNTTRDTSISQKMRRLGRAKMKRDRILQARNQEIEMQNNNNVRQLDKMLKGINQRISQLKGAAVVQPTAKQV